MVPITTNTSSDLNVRIQKALEEKRIDPCAYQKYLRGKYGNASTSTKTFTVCLQGWDEESFQIPTHMRLQTFNINNTLRKPYRTFFNKCPLS